jgi:predicted ABC-type transport system involved in lysophospholipase L1 biosynthesis ATPase subunit
MSNQSGMVIRAEGISRGFRQGPKRVEVLQDVNLEVPAGTSLAIVGASGAGKSTLLHILGGLDKPDKGDVFVDGQSLWKLGDRARSDLRNSRMAVSHSGSWVTARGVICAIQEWASSTSSTICCLNSRPWKTLQCHC